MGTGNKAAGHLNFSIHGLAAAFVITVRVARPVPLHESSGPMDSGKGREGEQWDAFTLFGELEGDLNEAPTG